MLINHRLAGLSRRLQFVALIALVAALAVLRSAQAQSGTCTTSSNGYTVTVCITQPSNGATVSGVQTVTATATISGSSSGIGKLIFLLDGAYLITDYQSPYTFQLTTATYANGAHTLSVSASMRDGFVTSAPLVTLTFANAGAPPSGPAFAPVTPGPRPAGQSLIMAAVGDGAGGETNAAQVTQLVDGWNPDLVLYLGDVYEKGSNAEFYNWYGTPSYFYGLFRDVTNPVIGNHEYENGVAPGYFAYWNNVPNYYSYNAGGWHFIALNSTSQFKQTATTSPQYQWLVDDLNSNNTPCSVAYFHHPVLSVGPQGDTTTLNDLWSLLAQAGVDMVLTGHDHGYQRWKPLGADLKASPGGTTEFVSGAGGHAVQGFVRGDDRFVVGYGDPTNSYGSLYFKLNPKGAEYRYINTAGKLLDQGVVPCSGAAADTAPPITPNNLVATTSASGHVALSWNAAWDETGVSGYGIYRDGALVATVGGAETSYVDMNVGLNVTYSYQVDAVDPGGLRSAQSNIATITRPSQATLIFNPIADTYVQSDVATTNYGTYTYLKADASPDTQSFLRFNLQGLAGSTISSAALRMYANNASNIGYQVFGPTSSSWTEAGTTYNDRPPTGSLAGSSGGYAIGSWAQANLPSLVTGDGQLDMAVKTTSNTSLSYSSREGANPPQLVVNIAAGPAGPTATPTDTPVPPTATATDTPVPPTATSTDTPVPPTATATDTPVPPTATPTDTPVPPTATATTVPPTATPTNTPVPTTAVTFAAAADAYVSSSAPTANFGTAKDLRVASKNPVLRSYLHFDLSGIAGPVTRITLRVLATNSSTKSYEVHTLGGGWVETSVNYNTALPIGSPVLGLSSKPAASSWTTVSLPTTLVTPATTALDLALIGTTTTATTFSSREGGNAAQLVVEYSGGAAAVTAAEAQPPQLDLPPASSDAASSDADSVDTDGDGAPDAVELLNGSSPAAADTDGDGLLDLWEIESGLSPVDASGDNGAAGDPDGDGSANLDEQRNGTDPFNPADLPRAGTTLPLFLPFVSHD